VNDAVFGITGLTKSFEAVIVADHLMGFLGAITDTVIVLDAGRPIFTGSLPSAIRDQEVVPVFAGERKVRAG
jgi:branched-chain amino acid transport system ATP-binding protein